MAESTRVSPEELERREKYLRAGLREVNLMDPFTWSYPMKGAGVMVGASLVSAHLYNMWNKRPFYFAIVPRLIAIGVMGAIGYGMGSLREHHYKTRDAVIQHYIELHPKDFDHFNDTTKMLDEAASSESSDAIARKKELLMQRLQQRRPAKQSKSGTDQAKLREEELTEVLNRAREQAESGVVDEETVKTLESFLSLEGCGWSAKRIQSALELLRKAGVGANSEGPQKSTFSFSISKKRNNSGSSGGTPKTTPAVPSESTSFIQKVSSDNAISLADLTGETRVVTGKDGNDVKLKEIRNCRLSFTFRPSTVHIQIFATAQQLRIHTSNELRLHVGVRAAVIIESCTNIRMAPYRVLFNNEPIEAPPGDAWKRPNDFDWLAEGQSPNWTVAPEEEWETAVVNSSSQ
ncbi:hypothetical protein ANCCEY_14088 [Ancylostoma ceylanicum]|uniref:C-CAP/cofactor C-like domain-containing protein n=1 Tax=Ancylostoma ceylanicum TaxID=53326 RepID=A0A0D6L658_9BILA|nr:hypothetical protein ANCCEY_14088 [Ancylostoma ceylanicum]